MVICLERGADLHTAQLMPLPLTVSCFSIIQIGFTFLVPAHPGSPGQRAVKRVCVCVYVKFTASIVVGIIQLLVLSAHHIYNDMRILQNNIQSICTSLPLLQNAAQRHQIDAILLQEMWHPPDGFLKLKTV